MVLVLGSTILFGSLIASGAFICYGFEESGFRTAGRAAFLLLAFPSISSLALINLIDWDSLPPDFRTTSAAITARFFWDMVVVAMLGLVGMLYRKRRLSTALALISALAMLRLFGLHKLQALPERLLPAGITSILIASVLLAVVFAVLDARDLYEKDRMLDRPVLGKADGQAASNDNAVAPTTSVSCEGQPSRCGRDGLAIEQKITRIK